MAIDLFNRQQCVHPCPADFDLFHQDLLKFRLRLIRSEQRN